MRITEQPLPRPTPNQKEPVLINYDSTTPLSGPYVNILIWYAHLSAIGEREPGTVVQRSTKDPAEFLVLLPGPVTGVCTVTGETFTFNAAVLREFEGGIVDGWLCDDHEAAKIAFELQPTQED